MSFAIPLRDHLANFRVANATARIGCIAGHRGCSGGAFCMPEFLTLKAKPLPYLVWPASTPIRRRWSTH